MKYQLAIAASAFLAFSPMDASALVIDASSGWNGFYSINWEVIGQSFTVDLVETHLDSMSFYFSPMAAGQTFGFTLSDSLSGGTTLYQEAVVITEGVNKISPDIQLSGGSVVYALFDLNEYSGRDTESSLFGLNAYAGGQGFWYNTGSGWEDFAGSLDHRFIAEFSSPTPIPVPAALPLFASVLGAMGFLAWRRKQKAAA